MCGSFFGGCRKKSVDWAAMLMTDRPRATRPIGWIVNVAVSLVDVTGSTLGSIAQSWCRFTPYWVMSRAPPVIAIPLRKNESCTARIMGSKLVTIS